MLNNEEQNLPAVRKEIKDLFLQVGNAPVVNSTKKMYYFIHFMGEHDYVSDLKCTQDIQEDFNFSEH